MIQCRDCIGADAKKILCYRDSPQVHPKATSYFIAKQRSLIKTVLAPDKNGNGLGYDKLVFDVGLYVKVR